MPSFPICLVGFLILMGGSHCQDLNEQIALCGSPIRYTLLNLRRWKSHSSVALFSSKERTYYDLVSDGDKEFLSIFSVSSQAFHLDAFAGFYFETNKTYESVAVLLPNTLEEAKNALMHISVIEKKLEKAVVWNPMVVIAWPRICKTSGIACLSDVVSKMPPEHLPSLLTEAFILQCELAGNKNKSWDVYSAYTVGRNDVLQVKRMDEWDDIYDPYARKWNFNGAKLLTSIPTKVLKEELVYETKDNVTRLVSGLAANVVNFMQEALNFSLDFLYADHRVRQIDGIWVGMSDQLANNEIDFSMAKTTFLPTRKDAFTFLIPHFTDGVGAFFRQPPASSIRNIFLQPFQKELWATLIVVWVLVVVSSLLAAKIKAVYDDLDEADEGISKDTILWAVAFTCQQGWHIDPESITMKIIFFCGSVLGLIVYVAYSAALVSSLSTAVVPINTFRELLHQNYYFCHENDSETMANLLSTQSQQMDREETNLLRQKIKTMDSDDLAVAEVFKTHTSFLSFPDTFYSKAKNNLGKDDRKLCEDIYMVKVSRVPFRGGMVIRKMAPYKEFFNVRLIELYEQGLLARFKTHYGWQFGGVCEKSRTKKDVGLGMADLFSAYCIILIGYVLSFLIALIEWIYFRFVGSSIDKIDPTLALPMSAFY